MDDPDEKAFIIATALCDIADACRKLGIKPPSALAFHSGHNRNVVSDALDRVAGVEGLRIKRLPGDKIEVDGIGLVVRW